MKGSIVAAAAALFGAASASRHQHRHQLAHDMFKRSNASDLCTTYYKTVTGELIWKPTPGPLNSTTTYHAATSTSYTTTTTTPTTTVVTVPTLQVETCATPGTYTFPAKTVVVTETTTVCGATTTAVPSGTHTLGGVTTVVETSTVVTCPVATTKTQSNGVVTSVIETTTYVCPSAGTYTINPITTTVLNATVVVVPVVTTFTPGTYTKSAVVTTVTETNYVVYCPFDVTSTSSPLPTSTSVPATTPVKTAVVVETTPAVETTSSAVVVMQSATTSSAQATVSASTSVSLGGGDQWAITYTPYTTDGQCKGASAVLSDLQEIKSKGFSTVRVYSTDCDTLPNVGAGCESTGLKMIIGVFISEVGCNNGNPDVASQIAAIKSWGKWNLVELVVVGNEAGLNGYCTPAELKSLIVEVKEIVSSAGSSVPVTTTDTVNTWQNTEFSGALCSVVDVVACNAHAYFNAETAPSQAGTFVKGQLEIVKNICGKEGYVLESGWPSECVANGVATCSSSDQETAIASLKTALGGSIVFFSYGNDKWKDNGSCGCEQHWGCGQLF